MARMRMLKPNDYPSLRWSLFCGEPLPLQLAELWRKSAPNSTVENLYGPTEATIAITAYRLRPGAHGNVATHAAVPLGRPFSGQGAVVIGLDGRPVPEGEAGELYLFGSQVTDGYWKLPETTAARFAPPLGHGSGAEQWYRTGDRVVMDRDHSLLFLGRIDRQVKIRGHRVELQEVEAVLRAVTGSDSVAAIAWPVAEDTGLASGIIAFVAEAATGLDSALAQCRARLPDYMVPSQVHRAPDWPLNAGGKTDYNALRARLGGNR
jgi:acyl-CoA synthetase (AMP-forming)/AMP-acid ligase II